MGRGLIRVEKQAVEGKEPKWRPPRGVLATRINTPEISSRLFFLLTPPMKMEQAECSETSAHKIQKPGNHPKERMQYSEQGECFKSRITKSYRQSALILLISRVRKDFLILKISVL